MMTNKWQEVGWIWVYLIHPTLLGHRPGGKGGKSKGKGLIQWLLCASCGIGHLRMM